MADNTNIGLTVEAWAKIVIERWEAKIKALKIGAATENKKQSAGNLAKSFTHHVFTQANGNPDKIQFAFEVYGKFVDMGVGRGMPTGSRVQLGNTYYAKRNDLGQLHSYNRVPKAWYSSVMFGQIQKLKEILAEKYAEKAQMTIITDFEQKEI